MGVIDAAGVGAVLTPVPAAGPPRTELLRAAAILGSPSATHPPSTKRREAGAPPGIL